MDSAKKSITKPYSSCECNPYIRPLGPDYLEHSSKPVSRFLQVDGTLQVPPRMLTHNRELWRPDELCFEALARAKVKLKRWRPELERLLQCGGKVSWHRQRRWGQLKPAGPGKTVEALCLRILEGDAAARWGRLRHETAWPVAAWPALVNF